MKNRIWTIADTHFGHKNMVEYCGRPTDFSERIEKNLLTTLKAGDVLIHLGDICIGRDQYWHDRVIRRIPAKKWLCIGNHDRKSNTWYLNNGWDMVCRAVSFKAFQTKVLFSHKPQALPLEKDEIDLNIHGHFHNSNHRDQEPHLTKRLRKNHYCFILEHQGYTVVKLENIINEVRKKL